MVETIAVILFKLKNIAVRNKNYESAQLLRIASESLKINQENMNKDIMEKAAKEETISEKCQRELIQGVGEELYSLDDEEIAYGGDEVEENLYKKNITNRDMRENEMDEDGEKSLKP